MLFVVSRYDDQPSWPKLSTLERGKTYAVRLLELLAIEGDPMNSRDSAFAKLRAGELRFPSFATRGAVLYGHLSPSLFHAETLTNAGNHARRHFAALAFTIANALS
jgi:hypothetical protein